MGESFYSDASVYDILHTPGTAGEVDGLEHIVARFLDRADRLHILEPACGSGRYLRVLARRGHSVVGFDTSAAMIAYATEQFRRQGLMRGARVLQLDMENFGTSLGRRRFDLAFNLINTIRHLESTDAMHAHLKDILRVLTPDGIYIVGLSLSAPSIEPPSEDVWEARRGRCHVRQLVSYLPPSSPGDRREQVLSHLTITTPGGVRYADSSYWLRTYTLRQWRSVVAGAGLTIAGIVDEDGADLKIAEPGYGLFVLRAAGRTHKL